MVVLDVRACGLCVDYRVLACELDYREAQMKTDKLELLLEWSFGFALLVFYWALAHVIAVRQVTEVNSYGLPIILNSLSGLGGAWGVLIVARRKERKANGNGAPPESKP